MIEIIENHSLKSLNSFGVDTTAKEFVQVTEIKELSEIYNSRSGKDILILGEGSNILFQDSYDGLLLQPALKGIRILEENQDKIKIKVSCGENWDHVVEYCVERNWGGLENLSHIPGSVGSAPVQNIGAYGVEVKDRIVWVEGIKHGEDKISVVQNKDCRFGYRQSIFKQEWKGNFLISHVVFELDKKPEFKLNYGHLSARFSEKKEQNLKELRKTIIEIRESKLPDPEKYGNAGSFFKNPVVSKRQFSEILSNFPELPSYPSGENLKIPAAWLIEKSGWKGVRKGEVGTWPGQPLVIVNYGKASGKEIFEFSRKIQSAVYEKFGIHLEREVNLV